MHIVRSPSATSRAVQLLLSVLGATSVNAGWMPRRKLLPSPAAHLAPTRIRLQIGRRCCSSQKLLAEAGGGAAGRWQLVLTCPCQSMLLKLVHCTI